MILLAIFHSSVWVFPIDFPAGTGPSSPCMQAESPVTICNHSNYLIETARPLYNISQKHCWFRRRYMEGNVLAQNWHLVHNKQQFDKRYCTNPKTGCRICRNIDTDSLIYWLIQTCLAICFIHCWFLFSFIFMYLSTVVGHWLALLPHNMKVVGSSPSGDRKWMDLFFPPSPCNYSIFHLDFSFKKFQNMFLYI